MRQIGGAMYEEVYFGTYSISTIEYIVTIAELFQKCLSDVQEIIN